MVGSEVGKGPGDGTGAERQDLGSGVDHEAPLYPVAMVPAEGLDASGHRRVVLPD